MTSEPQGARPANGGSNYRGRFAPSPTGPLHFGSLIAATASYLQARVNRGEWLLRIENIDPPRELAGADLLIIASLQAHGFRWDGDILYQHDSIEHCQNVIADLLARDLAYPCTCSREQIRKIAQPGPVGLIYPGTCRGNHGDQSVDTPHAIRVRTTGTHTVFDDAVRGRFDCDIPTRIGDFIIRRKDGLVAYSLAVVIDDHAQGITEVVRGADLLEFTPAQLHLQNLLGLTTPRYMHVPIALNPAGDKLSKQTNAPAIDDATPAANLFRCLQFLGQSPPTPLATATLTDIWDWSVTHWNPRKLAAVRESPVY